MNNILQKCVDELNRETPRLDYLRGMLETLIEMQVNMEVKTEVKTEVKPVTPQPIQDVVAIYKSNQPHVGEVEVIL